MINFVVRVANKHTLKFITQAFFPTLEACERFSTRMLSASKEPIVARIYEIKEELVKTIDGESEEAGKDQKK